MQSFDDRTALVSERRVASAFSDCGPHPAVERRLKRRRLEIAAVNQSVTECAGETDRPIPEDGMSDQARRLLRRCERPELQHRALQVEATPRECVKAGVPEELIGILRRIRARIAEAQP